MTAAPFICAECKMPFASKGGSPLCRKCSAAADVIIRSMVAQGSSSKSIAFALHLTKVSVDWRRSRLKIPASVKAAQAKAAKVKAVQVKPIAKAVAPKIIHPPIVTAQPKLHPGPKSFHPVCQWPSNKFGLDMHVCTRSADVEIRCDDAA